VELLATFEMAQRGFADLRRTIGQQGAEPLRPNAESERLVTVHQATGMLMERDHLEADAAVRRMRQLAQRTGLPLEEVAARLVRHLPVQ
jgi:AmiR/NasT family two-component response regulator